MSNEMPLYYFDMTDHEVFIDEDGVELADDAAACREAVRALTAFAADTAPSGDNGQVFTILVSNARRDAIYSATLALDGGKIHREE